MEYCNLGNSGLEVARLGLGTIPFGTILDDNACQRFVDTYEDAGGNLVDTSNLYGGGTVGTNTEMAGTAERAVGRALKGKRHRFAVATKGYWLMQDEVRPNSVGLSRTYLSTQIEASLRRLGTDYIDLYQCHIWDFYTPVEETMRVLDDFVRAGKIRYVGVSNWDGWHVVKANCHARSANLTPILSNQIWYNLADRGRRELRHPGLPGPVSLDNRLGRVGHWIPNRKISTRRRSPGCRREIVGSEGRRDVLLAEARQRPELGYAGRTFPYRRPARSDYFQRGYALATPVRNLRCRAAGSYQDGAVHQQYGRRQLPPDRPGYA